MEITTEMIKELRGATGAGILDCRKALTKANGDFDKAVDFLREKGIATAAKRADRTASQGVVELYSHGEGRVGVIVEVNCETDFVARSEDFRKLAHEIALQIAASAPRLCHMKTRSRLKSWSTKRRSRVPAPRKKASPKQSCEKIVAGRLEKFKDEVVLLRQTYIRDEELTIEKLVLQTIGKTGENIIDSPLPALGVG